MIALMVQSGSVGGARVVRRRLVVARGARQNVPASSQRTQVAGRARAHLRVSQRHLQRSGRAQPLPQNPPGTVFLLIFTHFIDRIGLDLNWVAFHVPLENISHYYFIWFYGIIIPPEREHLDECGPVFAVPGARRARLRVALPRLETVRRVFQVDDRGDGEEGRDPYSVGLGHRRIRCPERRTPQHSRRLPGLYFFSGSL